MHLLILWFPVYKPDGAIIQHKHLNRVYFDCKIYFYTRSFYQQGILNDINEHNASFPGCKHKNMIKSGAPPEIIGVLHHLLPIEFHGFSSRIDF